MSGKLFFSLYDYFDRLTIDAFEDQDVIL